MEASRYFYEKQIRKWGDKQPLQSFFFLTKILNFRISVKLHFLKPYIIATHISLACNKNYIKIEGSALCEVRQEFNGPQFTVGTSVLKLTPKLKNNKTILIKTIWFYVVLCSCFFLEEKKLKVYFLQKRNGTSHQNGFCNFTIPLYLMHTKYMCVICRFFQLSRYVAQRKTELNYSLESWGKPEIVS